MSLLLMLSYPPRMLALALLLAPALPAFLATLFCRPGTQQLRYGRGRCQFIWVFQPRQRAHAAAPPQLPPQCAAAAAPPPPPLPPITTSLIVSGGAWLATSAAWGWPFLRALGGDAGHAVVLVNYRQYPWASAEEQVQDIQAALALVRARAPSWGGSAAHLQLFGQSAGAHLCALAVAREALQRSAASAAAAAAAAAAATATATAGAGGAAALPFASPLPLPTGSAAAASAPAAAAAAAAAAAPPLRHLFLASGVYDLPGALPHLRARGFPAAALRGLFPTPALLAALSPALLLAQPPPPHPRRALPPGAHPPTTLFHGAADASVPAAQSRAYAAALAAAGVACALREAPGQGHTETVLEGPLEGSGEVSECMLAEGREGGGGGGGSRGAAAAAAGAGAPPPPVLPRWWVRLIRLANPF